MLYLLPILLLATGVIGIIALYTVVKPAEKKRAEEIALHEKKVLLRMKLFES